MDIRFILFIAICLCQLFEFNAEIYGEAKTVFSLANVDYEWDNISTKADAVTKGEYIVQNNIVAGIKVFGDDVYVTTPRWREGVPSTLNKVIQTNSGQTILKPFPNWSMNEVGDCNAFQFVQSMEIDPNTGYMWIIDVGRVNTRSSSSDPVNLCPAKLIIIDLKLMTTVRKFIFPSNVASPTSNYLNDIVIDYVGGKASFAYISDAGDAKLIVYDYSNNLAYFYHHSSMNRPAPIQGLQDGMPSAAIDGIAMSADFRYVYYCTLPALDLFAIPTNVLRTNLTNQMFAKDLVDVGRRRGASGGIIYGQTRLYYGVYEQDAVYMTSEGTNGIVHLTNERKLIQNHQTVAWADTFAFNGTDLWFVANNLPLWFKNQMTFSGKELNMFLWKINVGEEGYLSDAIRKTAHSSVPGLFG